MKEATDRRDTFNTSPGESEASQQSGGPQWGGGGGDGVGGVGLLGAYSPSSSSHSVYELQRKELGSFLLASFLISFSPPLFPLSLYLLSILFARMLHKMLRALRPPAVCTFLAVFVRSRGGH